MKKVLLSVVVMIVTGLAFAKPFKVTQSKIRSVKDISKIAVAYDFEVLENYTDLYVSKSEDSDDFAVFYREDYTDGNIQFSFVCIDGEFLSRTIFNEKNSSGSPVSYTINEYDKQCSFNEGSNPIYLTELGTLYYTVVVMDKRNEYRAMLAEKYKLILPEAMQKNDKNFKKVFDENKDNLNDKDALQKIINSNFAY